MNRFIVKSLPLIAAASLPMTATAHDVGFAHAHVNQAAKTTQQSTSSYNAASQPGVINPVYGGKFAKENHRFVITSNVETSVETAIADLDEEERALKKRDYEKNTKWIDGWRDAYKDDIRDLQKMEKRLEAMQKVQMDDAVEGYGGPPSKWKVGAYDTPYINRGKWLTLEEIKEYFRPKSTKANYPRKEKTPGTKEKSKGGIFKYFRPKSTRTKYERPEEAPKAQEPKKKKKGLGGLLKKADPRNW